MSVTNTPSIVLFPQCTLRHGWGVGPIVCRLYVWITAILNVGMASIDMHVISCFPCGWDAEVTGSHHCTTNHLFPFQEANIPTQDVSINIKKLHMWPPTRKSTILHWQSFLVITITANYNLWSCAPANLKCPAQVVAEVSAKIHPNSPYTSFQKNAMKLVTFIPSGFPYTRHLCVYVGHTHKVRSSHGHWLLKREQRWTFRTKIKRSQECLNLVIVQNRMKKCMANVMRAAAVLVS